MDQQNVCILHYAGPPIVGGVESTIDHHARLLAETGFHVQIIAGRGAQPASNIEFTHIDLLDSRHPQILAIGEELARGQVSEKFYSLRDQITTKLQPHLKKADYVIVHNVVTLHKNLPLTAALHELARQGHQLIAWCHDFAWRDELYTSGLHAGYPWELMSKPWVNVFYVVVSADRQRKLASLLEIPPDRIEVIMPGVDLMRFLGISAEVERIAKKAKLHKAQPLLLLPSRITRRKNIEFAIQVTHHLRALLPAVSLVITGPPGAHNPTNIQYLEKLQAQRRELDIEDQVHFLYQYGKDDAPLHLTDQMVSELYRLADALFFPSKREGFGIPVLEAGLTRLPVFASDIPPVRESTGMHAHLFDLRHADATWVARMINDELQKNQEYQLRTRIKEIFTWQALLERKILPLFERVRNKNG